MRQLKKFKPAFWDHKDVSSNHPHSAFNFARKWKIIVFFTSFMAILPLFVMSYVEFSITQKTIESEIETNMLKFLNHASTSIVFSDSIQEAADGYAANTEVSYKNDIFIVDSAGKVLTSSFYYKKEQPMSNFQFFIQQKNIDVKEITAPDGSPVIAGYAKILKSPYILVHIKSKKSISDLWLKPRLKLIGYLFVSVIVILLSIMGMATYLVNRIHSADKKRTEAIHHAEYKNKLASIGRLSSGVAHEINNPLAIINQKTGLIQDIFQAHKDLAPDDRFNELSNDVLDAVKRCGAITKRLLDFAQHTEPSIESVNLIDVVNQMIAFHKKEAEFKKIEITLINKSSIPDFICDRGSLQQIFFNLFDNAFAAMEQGGKLDIAVEISNKEIITILISDTGKGIAIEDVNKIFEPFYSSKNEHWGTGLGLSITYGMVKEIGGDIMVKSKVGKGTKFTITIPLNGPKK